MTADATDNPALADAGDWQPLPPAARTVWSIATALSALLPSTAVAVVVFVAADDLSLPLRVAAALGIWLLPVALLVWLARARWRRTHWRLDANGLRVRRGLVWRSEVLVPRSRVQHLDLERGPIERRFGLATLVVHTAGTRMHALRQSGFHDADAVALRDALLPEADRHDDSL
ncbi:PH domain-containing protein [Arenimonas sp.]|uniref:PH domain-containing protein n=1 Tax=Arenimonas sp. TaxID=1872635 RepID=UPI0025E45761|nr:PH domain-containing protein [Arenimonas sp.]